MRKAKGRYNSQKSSAKARGIDFNLTFDEWYNWWLSNGVDKNSPVADRSFNKLCMCRKNDTGAYELGNIFCATQRVNIKTQNYDYCKKKRMTPYGMFESRAEAGRALGLDPKTVGDRVRRRPKEYYYL